METTLEKLQLENCKLRTALLKTNPLIGKILQLKERRGKERYIVGEIKEKEWLDLENTINTCYSDFANRLKNTYPKLTRLDIRYCCLIKLHVPLVDVSTLMHVSPNTVFTVKYRIYKLKIGAIENLDLDGFLDYF